MQAVHVWPLFLLASLLYLELFALVGERPSILDISIALITGYGAKRHRWISHRNLVGVARGIGYIAPAFEGALSVAVWIPRPIFLHLMMLNIHWTLLITCLIKTEFLILSHLRKSQMGVESCIYIHSSGKPCTAGKSKDSVYCATHLAQLARIRSSPVKLGLRR